MRTSGDPINKVLKKRIQKTLAQTIADLDSESEAGTFLESFFTTAEYETFAKRLAVAYWLKKNRSYANIKRNLKVSSATVASVQKQMQGKGFQKAIKNLEAEEWANVWDQRIKKFVGK